jgi:uncharacterized membrane protein YvbJ
LTSEKFAPDTGLGSGSSFCPNCGTRVDAGIAFCPNCGAPIHVERTNTTSGADDNQTAPVAPVQSRQPMSKKTRAGIIGAIIMILALIGVYMGTKAYYSPDRQFNRIIDAVNSHDPKKIAKVTSSDDSKITISTNSLRPLIKYLKANKAHQRQFIAALKSGSSNFGGYEIAYKGKKYGMFPEYKMNLNKGAYQTVGASKPNIAIYQDGKKVFTTSRKQLSKKIGPVVPGNYTYQAKGKVGTKKVDTKSTVSVGNNVGTGKTDLQFQFRTLKLKLKSDIEGGKVMDSNGNQIGVIKDGKFDSGELNYNPKTKYYVTKKFGSKTVESSKVLASDSADDDESNVTIEETLNGHGGMELGDAGDATGSIAANMGVVVGDHDDLKADGVESDFADGFANTTNRAYKALWNVATGFQKRDDVEGVVFFPEERSIKWLTADSWSVNIDITYQIMFKDDAQKERYQTYNADFTFIKGTGEQKGHYVISDMTTKLKKVYDNNADTNADAWGDSKRNWSRAF